MREDTPNHLALETSPYLRQHADNPVNWYPWGEEALGVFPFPGPPHSAFHRLFGMSLVYVMERESFEDDRIC